MCVVKAESRLLYPRERPGTHCTVGRVGPRASLDECEKSRPTGIRTPDRISRSESLYRLNYRGPLCCDGYIVRFTLYILIYYINQ